MSNWKDHALTVLTVGLVIAFLMAGATKLMDDPMHVETFTKLELSSTSMYSVGLIEILGAGLVMLTATRFYGGLVLLGTMLGAAFMHLSMGVDMFMIGMNAMLGGTAALVAWANRPKSLLGFILRY